MMAEWSREDWELFYEEHAEEWRRDAYYDKHPEEIYTDDEVIEDADE